MIQRVQTLWLLAAGICGFAALKMPFYIGSVGTAPAEEFTATTNTLLMILTVAAAIVALVDIFLYNNRPLQFRIGLSGLAVSVLNIVLYFIYTKKYDTGAIALSSVFSFAIPAFFLMAIIGIRKDEKLVKSVDRLR
jgi:DMSO/TMAO reductase YedYZ heme-binding membrane subunit